MHPVLSFLDFSHCRAGRVIRPRRPDSRAEKLRNIFKAPSHSTDSDFKGAFHTRPASPGPPTRIFSVAAAPAAAPPHAACFKNLKYGPNPRNLHHTLHIENGLKKY
jgi:hypothetical protein